MEIAITGATGKLGASVVKALRKHKLRLLVRNKKIAQGLFFGKKIVQIDLEKASTGEMRRAVHGVDAVIHLAGLVDLCASHTSLFSANYEATKKLVKACEAEQVPFFVHCSTIAVYRDSSKRIGENAELQPSTLYGRSKLAGENIVRNSSLNWIILRPGLIYGPAFTDGFGDVIRLMQKRRAVIVGKGNNRVPLVFETDAANAFVKALEAASKGKTRLVFNIVAPEPTQLRCYKELSKIFDLPMPTQRVPLLVALAASRVYSIVCSIRGKRGFPPEYVSLLARNRTFDTRKARHILKWRARVSLARGLQVVRKAWS